MDDIAHLEQVAHQLEQDGDDMKAIRYMEKAAALRGDVPDPEAMLSCERLAIKYNTVAVRSFKSDDYETAAALLANALHLTDAGRSVWGANGGLRLRLRGTTYNNMGCMERRRGRLELAAKYLRMSLDHDGNQSAVTYLNLGAIYTQMSRPEEAVACSRRAIGLLTATASSDSPGLIAIAHHNLAMALEPLDRDACASAYETALSLSKAQLGATSPTTVSIQRNYDRFMLSAKNIPRGANGATGSSGKPPAPSQTFLPPLPSKSLLNRSDHTPTKSHRNRSPERELTPRASTSRGARALTTNEAESKSARKPAPPSTAPSRSLGAGGGAPRPPTDRASKAGSRRAQAFSQQAKGKDYDSGADSMSDSEATTPPPQTAKGGASAGAASSAKQLKPAPPTAPKTKSGAQSNQAPNGNSNQTDTTIQNGRIKQLDAEDERRKEDVIAFMVSRLGALLRAEDEFEVRYVAAVKIQCLARRVAAREAAAKRRVARKQGVLFREVRERKAAATLIAFFRTLVDRRRAALEAHAAEQQAEVRRNKAAVKIQATARRWLARQLVKRLRVYYRDYTKALRRLQCWFRKEIAIRRVDKMKLVERDAMKQKVAMEMRGLAAVQIQRSWRAYAALNATAARKRTLRAARERDRDSNRTHSAKRIQALWRGVLGRNIANGVRRSKGALAAKRERAEQRERAAIVLQALFRGIASRVKSRDIVASVIARRKQRIADRQTKGAVNIQCFIRQVLARVRVHRFRIQRRAAQIQARKLFAVVAIQPFVRATLSAIVAASRLPPPPPAPVPQPTVAAPLPVQAPREGSSPIRRLVTPTAEEEQQLRQPLEQAKASATSFVPATFVPVSSPVPAIASPLGDRSIPAQLAAEEDLEARGATSPLQTQPLRPVTPPREDLEPPSSSSGSAAREEEENKATPPPPSSSLAPSRVDAAAVTDAITPPPATVAAPQATADDDAGFSEPYVVPPRVPTPPNLKLSIAYLEEKRKRELAERQQRRLAELDPKIKVRTTVADEHAQRAAAAAAEQAAERQRKLAKANRAAERIQAFFRGVFDRTMFREKRAVIAEYINALEATHRFAPNRPPTMPPLQPNKDSGAPKRHSFAALHQVTDQLGPRIETHRRALLAVKLQMALRGRQAQTERNQRVVALKGHIRAAGFILTRFGRRVIARARFLARRAAVQRRQAERAAAEHRQYVEAEEAEQRRIAEAEAAQRAQAERLEAQAALRKAALDLERRVKAVGVLHAFRRIILAKAVVKRRRASLADAIAFRVAEEVLEAAESVRRASEERKEAAAAVEAADTLAAASDARCTAAQARLRGFALIIQAKRQRRDRQRRVVALLELASQADAAMLEAQQREFDRVASVLVSAEDAMRTRVAADETAARTSLHSDADSDRQSASDRATARAAQEKAAIENGAALSIQSAVRQSRARQEVSRRRDAKQRQWEQIAQQEETESDPLPALRETTPADPEAAHRRDASPVQQEQLAVASPKALTEIADVPQQGDDAVEEPSLVAPAPTTVLIDDAQPVVQAQLQQRPSSTEITDAPQQDDNAVEEPSLVAPAPTAVIVDDAPPAAVQTQPQQRPSEAAAAATIQRSFRVHAAKNEVARRRQDANERWEQRRAQLASEEADVSF